MKIYPCKKAGGIKIESLTVSQLPSKTTYLVGENLDLTGVEVTATAGLLSGDVASESEFDPADGTQLNIQGNKRVDVRYGGVSTYFDVDVSIRHFVKSLPVNISITATGVVYNNEIYILASRSLYKWDGTSWIYLSQFPRYMSVVAQYNHCDGLIYKNKLMFFGGTSESDYQGGWGYLTKYENDAWTPINTQTSLYYAQTIIWKGYYYTVSESYIKKYDENTLISTVSIGQIIYGNSNEIYNPTLVADDNYIYIIGKKDSNTHIMAKFDGTSVTLVGYLPQKFDARSRAVLYKNEIHLFQGTWHYKYNGTSWSSVSTLPFDFQYGIALVWNSGADDEIVLCQGKGTKQIAQWDGTSWTVGSN